MRHRLRRSPRTDKVIAGQLYAVREIAARTGLTQEQALEAVQAYYEVAWEVILSGYRLRLGDLGELSLCVRQKKGGRLETPLHDTVSEWETCVPGLDLRGKLSRAAKESWHRVRDYAHCEPVEDERDERDERDEPEWDDEWDDDPIDEEWLE